MDLNEFIRIMEEIGFDLVKYYADVHVRHKTEIKDWENIVENPLADEVYSGCWFGGDLFRWLFPQPTIPVTHLSPDRVTHGYLDSDQECHYFFFITTQEEAILFNTYGGVLELIIKAFPLDQANHLLNRIRQNDVSAFESLFGVSTDYSKMKLEVLKLDESYYQLPTKKELREKVDELIKGAHTIEDKRELLRLNEAI